MKESLWLKLTLNQYSRRNNFHEVKSRMARLEANRSGEMEVFVRAIETGSFAGAGRLCGMTASAVSKLIARLERRLGARLIQRSTRRLDLTPEGRAFHERAARILVQIDEAERAVASNETPRGRVAINVSASYGAHILAPLVRDFLDAHPLVSLDIAWTDAVVDLLDQRVDVAVRTGPLRNSSLRARSLGETRMVIVGSPDYLKRFGVPTSVKDLEAHERLAFDYPRAISEWPMIDNGKLIHVPATRRLRASAGEALRGLTLAGAGLARLAEFTIREDLKAGRLIELLEDKRPADIESFHAVFLGGSAPVPARVRALLDFLSARGRVT
jgi:DNA-binding transcriptional LysR family regulator